MLQRIARRLMGRTEAGQTFPIVQRTVNNGCSFESCGTPWEGQEWHGWRLCPEHYSQTATRAAVRV